MVGVSPDAILVHDPIRGTARRKTQFDAAYATSNDMAEEFA
jgi:hypothetical protein